MQTSAAAAAAESTAQLWFLLLLLLCFLSSSSSSASDLAHDKANLVRSLWGDGSSSSSSSMEGGSFAYKSAYTRFAEVQQQCTPHLSDVSENPNFHKDLVNKKWSILNELSFLNGQWNEEDDKRVTNQNKRPLMPFVPPSDQNTTKGAHLASLWLTDVDVGEQIGNKKENIVNVSVVLQLGISAERALSYMNSALEGFQVYPGFSLMGILMEGIYAEMRSGERILCLVGSTRIPDRGKNLSQPFDWLPSVSKGGVFSPPLNEENQLKAFVRYPKDLILTSRAVTGRFESTRTPSESARYFDPIKIYSQLGPYSNYEFSSGELISSTCSQKEPLSVPEKVYRGTAFCTVIQEILTGQWVDVLPNWNCSTSKSACSKFGPFSTLEEDQSFMDGGFNGSQLLVQDIRCVEGEKGDHSSQISAVFRAVLPSQNKNLAFERSNLDGLTLASEGQWNGNSGELCMVGCKPDADNGGSPKCETKIRMFIPLSLSLKHRSILQGTISSSTESDGDSDKFYPLSFRLALYPIQLSSDVMNSISYEYSAIKEAGAILERDEPTGLGEQIKKSLLEYPSADGNLLGLFEDLSLRSLAITNPTSLKAPHIKQYVELDIVAIQDVVKLHWSQSSNYSSDSETESPFEKSSSSDKDEPSYYNIAAQLKLKDNLGNKVSDVSAEGLYDPASGRMFLVGCREVSTAWKTLQENEELLEEGLDCRMELRVRYPPANARWLMNPTVMLTLTSKRPADDPLYFADIELETFPILYKRQREEIVSRKSLEGVLSMLTLSLILGCIIGQLIYVKSHAESTPYISLLMLAVQGVGFSIPLITGMEALFARITSDQEDMRESVLNEGKMAHAIGYMVNLLTLATFLLTLRIMQKVYKSRLRLQSRRPLETWRVPSDKKVMLICLGVHVLGFLMVLIIHSIRISSRPASSSLYMDWRGGLHKQYDWERILKEYYGLVQDLFLLPQVVGNHIWVVRGKPLRSIFYVGVTVLRLLPHIYDGLRPSVFNPYFSDEFQYANPSSDFYSKAGDIAIPLFAVILAIVVYIQQRWNGLKWAKVLRQGSNRLMRMGSKMYERLPSKTFEAEMVESVVTPDEPFENDAIGVTTEH